jgi:hypothetical protein
LILDISSNLTFNNQYLIKKVKIQQVFVFFLNAFSIILIYNTLVLRNSDQHYSTMVKGNKGQNRQTVISNTAQWPKEKKDKIDKQ